MCDEKSPKQNYAATLVNQDAREGVALPGGLRGLRDFHQVSFSIPGMPVATGELGREQLGHTEYFRRAYRLPGGSTAARAWAGAG